MSSGSDLSPQPAPWGVTSAHYSVTESFEISLVSNLDLLVLALAAATSTVMLVFGKEIDPAPTTKWSWDVDHVRLEGGRRKRFFFAKFCKERSYQKRNETRCNDDKNETGQQYDRHDVKEYRKHQDHTPILHRPTDIVF